MNPLKLRLPAGTSRDFPLQAYNKDGTPATTFLSSDTLTCSVWPGDGQATVLTPAIAWTDAAAGEFTISFDDTDTAAIAPSRYRIRATASRGGRSASLLPTGSTLEIIDVPGTSTCTDLVTQDALAAALAAGGMDLKTAEVEALPALASIASDLIRRACGDRDFNQQEYDRIFPLELDGSVSLPQVPVLKVSRVCAERNTGLIVTNTDQLTNQRATVEYYCSGDEAVGITYTGILLTRVASGVASTNVVTFTTGPTLAALASVVNVLGGGWSAAVASGYELVASTDLIVDDDTAQDTFSGASLDLWVNELAGCKVNKRTGILDCASGQVLGIDGPRWGPGWEIFAQDEREEYSKVRVIYTGGFVTIPSPIRQATILTVQAMLSSLRTDPRLSSESDGAYSYVINTAFADYALPKVVLGMIFPYVLHRT